LETLEQAATSGPGLAAGAFLIAAGLTAFGLRGRSRSLGAAGSFAIAAVLAVVAVTMVQPDSHPGPAQLERVQNAAAAPGGESDSRGLDLIAEAEQQMNRGDTEAAEEAVARALRMFEDQDDVAGQAFAHLGIGRMAHFTGQGDAARTSYQESLNLFRKAGQPADEARVLMALGDLEMDFFNWESAAEFFRQGRIVWAAVPQPKSDPHVLLSLESVALLPDGEEAAWDVLREAKLIFENLGDQDALDDVAYARAEVYQAVGDLLNARGDFGGAAEGFLLRGNHVRAATSFLEAARMDIAKGYNLGAEFLLDQAQASFAQSQDSAGQALVAMARGDLARLVGQFSAAATHYENAAASLAGTDHPEEAVAHLKLGQIWQALGERSQAERALKEALAVFNAAGRPAGAGKAFLSLGDLSLAAAGDWDAAGEYWSNAVDAARSGGDPVTGGRALLGLVGGHRAEGDLAEATAAAKESEELFRDGGAPIGLVLAALEQSDLARSSGDSLAALKLAENAGEIFQNLEQQVAEANRFLSLPPVNRIALSPATAPDTYRDGDGPLRGEVEAWEAERQANRAAFPDQNAEAHGLLAEIEARLSAALENSP
jgi:tetratricopeptide (TPR) repeat protein